MNFDYVRVSIDNDVLIMTSFPSGWAGRPQEGLRCVSAGREARRRLSADFRRTDASPGRLGGDPAREQQEDLNGLLPTARGGWARSHRKPARFRPISTVRLIWGNCAFYHCDADISRSAARRRAVPQSPTDTICDHFPRSSTNLRDKRGPFRSQRRSWRS